VQPSDREETTNNTNGSKVKSNLDVISANPAGKHKDNSHRWNFRRKQCPAHTRISRTSVNWLFSGNNLLRIVLRTCAGKPAFLSEFYLRMRQDFQKIYIFGFHNQHLWEQENPNGIKHPRHQRQCFFLSKYTQALQKTREPTFFHYVCLPWLSTKHPSGDLGGCESAD